MMTNAMTAFDDNLIKNKELIFLIICMVYLLKEFIFKKNYAINVQKFYFNILYIIYHISYNISIKKNTIEQIGILILILINTY